ncbi:MAG: ferrous iron transport protein B [Pseudomonadota bacterium]
MAKASEVRIPASSIPLSRHFEASVAVVGTPNSGKSTLFNRLTGLRQRIGNYPGVTVERHVGVLSGVEERIELVDLPGTHGLSAHSIEERLAVDAVFGQIEGQRPPDGLLAILDASNLYQGLFLIQQLLELRLPTVVALTMNDAAEASGLKTDIDALSAALGDVPVLPVVATTGKGVHRLKEALAQLHEQPAVEPPGAWPELTEAVAPLAAASGVAGVLLGRALLDKDSAAGRRVAAELDEGALGELERLRRELIGDEPPLALEARRRYAWVREALSRVQQTGSPRHSVAARVSQFFNQPWPGTLGLFAVMLVVFQAVFAWATPFMDLIDGASGSLGALVHGWLGDGLLASLLADGVIAGVGSVVIFLPQILILFLFIIVLEDSGYLARAAYLMDRVMRSVGLSGQSIIPMISSFACAVPGIMATRVIPNRRDRIATILAAPFMTCSARLPVYALLIAAFVPRQQIGVLNLQGLVLFGLYLFGIVMGILTAFMIRKTALTGPRPAFALMLPEFRRPNLRTVGMQLLARAKVFLKRAGTVIFTVAVVVWALAYFPRADISQAELLERRALVSQAQGGETREETPAAIDNEIAALQLERSYLGRAGKFVEPVFAPLGWDWRVSAAVIAGFPAREVVVAILGTVYAVGDDADEATLAGRLKASTWPDGRPVFTLPMVVGLLIFYAMCLQCAATIAVIRRETNSWRWPVFAWTYMTALGYFGALLAFQLGS